MKAMVLNRPDAIENEPLKLTELSVPEPGDDEILIRVQACGVCHTDLHTVEGELDLPKLPLIPGHQTVGVVERTGKNVKTHSEGDRVGLTWLNSACGRCEYCRQGLENLCDNSRFNGLDVNGGYAQYVVAPAAYAFPLPENFPDLQAAPLLCAGVIGYRSLRLSEIQSGQNLGLYGFGASAHVCIQIARYWGCKVYVFTRSEEHRRHARELGAVWTGGAEDTPPELMDGSIIFAPAGWIVPEALRVLKKGGTLAINAIYMSPIPEIRYDQIYFEKTVRSVANLTRQDAEELLQLAVEIPIKTDIEVYSLEEANRVLQRLKRSEIRGAAVLKIE